MYRSILGIFLLFGFLQIGAIYRYERLFDPVRGVTLDLLFDNHDSHTTSCACHRLSKFDFTSRSCAYVEQRLFPEERYFMSALRTLNQRSQPGQVTLIWEHGLFSDCDDQFIGFSQRLVKNQFKNLSYIQSDNARDAVEHLLCDNPVSRMVSVSGSSFSQPVPLPQKRLQQIKKQSGPKALKEYRDYHKLVVNRFQNHFGRRYKARKRFSPRDFATCDPFDALCDVEIVSHILSVPHKHIIVFAGGWHSFNISSFLREKLGYQRVAVHNTSRRGGNCTALKKIAQHHVPIKNSKRTHEVAR